jgi:hypothetical protein
VIEAKTKRAAVAGRCTVIADEVVPEYRGSKRSYSCTGRVAKRWQAAWDGACVALGGNPESYRNGPLEDM